MSEIKELVDFLSDPKPEVRLIAASHLLTVEGIADKVDEALLASMVESLARRLAGSFDFTKIALAILVNLGDHELTLQKLLERKTISNVYALITDKETPEDVVELAAMLLTNMTRSQLAVLQLLEMQSDFPGRRFLALCGKFLSASEPTSGRDALGWLANVLQNCSQVPETRRFILDKNRSLMTHLAQALQRFKTVQRRRGVAATVRNCLLDTTNHAWLLEPPVSLATHIFIQLVSGKAPYSNEEKRAMPLAVRDAVFEPTHAVEPDAETRALLVESVCLLCYHGINAERLKAWSGYAIMRELEAVESEERVVTLIHSAVEYLVREHADFVKAQQVAPGAHLSAKEKEALEKPRTPADIQREILALAEEEAALKKCAQCGKEPSDETTLMRCTGCYSVAFCSKKCQVACWKAHKPQCLKIQERNKKWQEEEQKNAANQEMEEQKQAAQKEMAGE